MDAAEELLIGAHFDEGREVLLTAAGRLGIGWPASRFRALVQLLWNTVGTRAPDADRADACWRAWRGIVIIDPALAMWFASLHRRLADDSVRDETRLLSIQILACGMVGWKGRADRLIARLPDPGQDAASTAVRHAFLGADRFFRGRWRSARDHHMQMLEGVGAGPRAGWLEVDMGTAFVGFSLYFMGDLVGMDAWVPRRLASAAVRGSRLGQATMNLCAVVVDLVHDEVERASHRLEAIGSLWHHFRGNQFPDYWIQYARTVVDLYANRGESAYPGLRSTWWRLHAKGLMFSPLIRCQWRRLQGRAALQAFDARGDAVWLRRAASLGTSLMRSSFPGARGDGAALLAAVAHARGSDTFLALLQEAASAYRAHDMELFATCCEARIADLNGETLPEWFAAQGVVRPGAFVQMVTPGFGRVPAG